MRQRSASALTVAQFLCAHPRVARVNCLGLIIPLIHARAAALVRGGSSEAVLVA